MTVSAEIYDTLQRYYNTDFPVYQRRICMLKCLKCPYKLGLIKCTSNPCPECKASKSKKHPFPEAEIKGIEIESK